MPLELGPSDSGETERSQHHPPVASTSYIPAPEQSGQPVLGYDAVASDFPEVTYPGQSFELPGMSLGGLYLQTELMDLSFYTLTGIPDPNLDPNLFLPPSFD